MALGAPGIQGAPKGKRGEKRGKRRKRRGKKKRKKGRGKEKVKKGEKRRKITALPRWRNGKARGCGANKKRSKDGAPTLWGG